MFNLPLKDDFIMAGYRLTLENKELADDDYSI